jgi:arginyl-tRNA synthetase
VNAPLAQLRAAVQTAAAAVKGSGAAPAHARVERPKRVDQGDYSTNVAMLLAPTVGAPPRDIAERVGASLAADLGGLLARYEVAGPGFLNLVLSDDWHRRALRTILDAGARYGGDGAHRPQRVLVEFVSANPTGPLVAASGRHAA